MLATMAALIALSVLLPVAGALVALIVLVLLRAADVTSRWLARRRSAQGPRRSDLVSMTAFYPWAVVRSVLSFLLLAPLALLCAVAAATAAVLVAGPAAVATGRRLRRRARWWPAMEWARVGRVPPPAEPVLRHHHQIGA